MKKTISIALIIICMAVIFWFSSMPGDESNTKSKSTIKEAIETIIPHKKAKKAEETISNEVNEISQNTQSQNQAETTTNPETKDANTTQTQQNQAKQKEEQLIEKLNKPLRKCMHASEYFVLSILIFNCLKTFKISGWKTVIIPIGIAFLYACTDEFHQLFIDGRTIQFTDVLIDTFGAILGVAMINVAIRIIGKIRQQKSTKKFQKTIAQ